LRQPFSPTSLKLVAHDRRSFRLILSPFTFLFSLSHVFFAALHGVRARVVRALRNGGLRFFFRHFSKLLIPHILERLHTLAYVAAMVRWSIGLRLNLF